MGQKLINVDDLSSSMYHEAFETDTDMQKWDSGCWIRYKMFERQLEAQPAVDAIPVWYIIRWYEKRYKLGSTVADDWERGLLKEKITEINDDFKNEKYLDNKQESERFSQMIKEVIELYND